jgi:cytochrome c-type biogenesis protein CcmH/NrfG
VSAARAQDAAMPEESRQRFDLGQQAFERGDFATALTEWERVYALMDGHPRRAFLLYNMARSHEELGRSAEALALYERFLAEAGEDAPNRAEAQRHANELRLRVRLDGEGEAAASSAEGGGFSPSPIGIAIGAWARRR